ncbi:hypothetical protein [Sphaerobacter thermophilus]|jgi:hypothetical protein|uniref:Uncharacterized protein n=1 Tax=Sphaerobacter thermophilus (strain ATCC 49802 / DSM 20745 / KCCM 41009 / NCIMB 13125 / S 6022) TaxID=479434 RepID=D1C881_SPHTD|nr:hypothetical protein [Sphaerobacter thermophilus]ACZ40024.1 hypothetical protein Sthe_2610 [Sphaerobacter thermophilus DSM 20745]PZN61297.1 MAG: hypothetical protein DIU58_14245 [Sphaerobacter thermophilus]
MPDGDPRNAAFRYCDVCGRVVPAASTQRLATHNLCLRCALVFQQSQDGNGTPPGDPRDDARWQVDPGVASEGRFASYQPTERELQWWSFISWLVATGRISAGQDEGAELLEAAEQS